MDNAATQLWTPETWHCFADAEAEAVRLSDLCIATHHVLIAVLATNAALAEKFSEERVTARKIRYRAKLGDFYEATGNYSLRGFGMPISQLLLASINHAYARAVDAEEAEISPVALLSAILEIAPDGSAGHAILTLGGSFLEIMDFLSHELGRPLAPAPDRDVHRALAARAAGNTRQLHLLPMKHLSRRSKLAVEAAKQAALSHGVSWIGPAYLLVGLAGVRGSVCATVLNSHGVEAGNTKALIAELTPKELTVSDSQLQYEGMTNDLQLLTRYANALAHRSGAEFIEPEHLLVAILRGETKAEFVLSRMHVDRHDVIDDLLRTMSDGQL